MQITGKPIVSDTDQIVGFFEREYYMFSNWSPHQILFKGKLYPTLEHAYHAMKFSEDSLQEEILKAKSPLLSKKLLGPIVIGIEKTGNR